MSLEKERPDIFFELIQPAEYRHPVKTGTFYGPLCVRFNGFQLYFLQPGLLFGADVFYRALNHYNSIWFSNEEFNWGKEGRSVRPTPYLLYPASKRDGKTPKARTATPLISFP